MKSLFLILAAIFFGGAAVAYGADTVATPFNLQDGAYVNGTSLSRYYLMSDLPRDKLVVQNNDYCWYLNCETSFSRLSATTYSASHDALLTAKDLKECAPAKDPKNNKCLSFLYDGKTNRLIAMLSDLIRTETVITLLNPRAFHSVVKYSLRREDAVISQQENFDNVFHKLVECDLTKPGEF